jgi:hypothetical protein
VILGSPLALSPVSTSKEMGLLQHMKCTDRSSHAHMTHELQFQGIICKPRRNGRPMAAGIVITMGMAGFSRRTGGDLSLADRVRVARRGFQSRRKTAFPVVARVFPIPEDKRSWDGSHPHVPEGKTREVTWNAGILLHPRLESISGSMVPASVPGASDRSTYPGAGHRPGGGKGCPGSGDWFEPHPLRILEKRDS